MKNKSMVMVMLILLAAVSLMTSAFAATSQTEAKVLFTEGDLEFETEDLETGLNNMNMNFGPQVVPGGAASFQAVDGTHVLRIVDARKNAGGWYVTVEMGQFTNTDNLTNQFDALITLQNPGKSLNTNDSSALAVNSPIEIGSMMDPIQVLSTNAGINRGTFDALWTKENTILSIDDDAVALIEIDAQYVVEMTWTLTEA